MFVGFWFGILILGSMSQGFHGMGLLTKNQRIWWNQLKASRMSLQTLVDSDVRFVGKWFGALKPIYFLRAQKKIKEFQILLDIPESKISSGSRFPNLWAGSWKFHHSISCWLISKRCHELLIQCGREIQMWRCTVVVFSLFWRLRPKMPMVVLLIFWDWNSPIGSDFFRIWIWSLVFSEKKTDVSYPLAVKNKRRKAFLWIMDTRNCRRF